MVKRGGLSTHQEAGNNTATDICHGCTTGYKLWVVLIVATGHFSHKHPNLKRSPNPALGEEGTKKPF